MDNTASPVICKPIEHGAAVVIHSLTKYIGGHGTAVAGSIVDSGNFDWTADPKRQPLFNEPDASYGGVIWGKAVPELTGANVPFAVRARVCLLRDLGSALAPDNAFAIIQGLETVALRMRQHCANAEYVVDFLKNIKKLQKLFILQNTINQLPIEQKNILKVENYRLVSNLKAELKLVKNLSSFKNVLSRS